MEHLNNIYLKEENLIKDKPLKYLNNLFKLISHSIKTILSTEISKQIIYSLKLINLN